MNIRIKLIKNIVRNLMCLFGFHRKDAQGHVIHREDGARYPVFVKGMGWARSTRKYYTKECVHCRAASEVVCIMVLTTTFPDGHTMVNKVNPNCSRLYLTSLNS